MHLNSVERLSAAPPPERGAVPRLAQGHLCGGSEGSGKTFLTQFPPHRLAGPVWELGEEGAAWSNKLAVEPPGPLPRVERRGSQGGHSSCVEKRVCRLWFQKL